MPVLFDSVGFSDRESNYSQPKLELCGIMKAMKKTRSYLYGTHFTLECDPSAIREMINAPDVPSAPMTRWLAYIHLFDFTFRHVPANDHWLPDILSREGAPEVEDADELLEHESDIRGVDGFLPPGEGGRKEPWKAPSMKGKGLFALLKNEQNNEETDRGLLTERVNLLAQMIRLENAEGERRRGKTVNIHN